MLYALIYMLTYMCTLLDEADVTVEENINVTNEEIEIIEN